MGKAGTKKENMWRGSLAHNSKDKSSDGGTQNRGMGENITQKAIRLCDQDIEKRSWQMDRANNGGRRVADEGMETTTRITEQKDVR